MKIYQWILFVILMLLCICPSPQQAWADEGDTTIVDSSTPEEITADNNTPELLEPSWRRGFDLRFTLAPQLMIVETDHYHYDTYFYPGGHLGCELGYRWPNAGVYLQIGVGLGAGGVGPYGFIFYNITAMGRFFVPIRENMEFMFGFGFGMSAFISIAMPVSIGLIWNFDVFRLGVELTYQGAVELDFNSTHDIRPTISLGYTF